MAMSDATSRNVRTVALALAVLLATGCARLHRVDRATFMEKAKTVDTNSSGDAFSFIGATGEGAYLELCTPLPFGNRISVWWTPLSEFTEAERGQLAG